MPTHSTVADVAEVLERLAPLRLAADWDNVGLLLGDRRANVVRVLTCLTLTSAVAAEAIETDVQMVVTHHPLPFRPIDRITADASSGAILLSLAAAGIAVWSSHTAWDSAVGGINDQLATLLRLLMSNRLSPTPSMHLLVLVVVELLPMQRLLVILPIHSLESFAFVALDYRRKASKRNARCHCVRQRRRGRRRC